MKSTIHRSCIRTNTFLGGDRELIMVSGVVTVACVFVLQTSIAFLFGVVLWFSVLFLTRLMTKADPRMRDVYLRHIKYQSVYHAKGTPFAETGLFQK